MTTFLMLPPQTPTTRGWASRLASALPQLSVVVAETEAEAARAAGAADAAFGMHVMGIDARRREAPPGVVKLDGPDALDSLLPLADFVILTVPHTPATEHFMHRARGLGFGGRRAGRTGLGLAVPAAHDLSLIHI